MQREFSRVSGGFYDCCAEPPEAGYEAIRLREEGLQRLTDPEIVEKARQEERIILTFDLDFGDLLAATSDPLQPLAKK